MEKRNFLKLLFLSIFFPLFLFLFSSKTYASNILFEDNFDVDRKPDWEEHLGPQGSWSVVNGEYIGTVVKEDSGDYPSYSVVGDTNWTNYSFEVRIKGTEGIDKKILFRYKSHMQEMYALNFIGGPSRTLSVEKYHPSAVQWRQTILDVPTKNGLWYNIKVVLENENIKVYVDNILKFDYNDRDQPILNGKIGLEVWPGFYAGYGGRTTIHYDDVIVKSLIPSLQPLILLPGLGGSWNYESMILGQERPQSEWYGTPGVKLYDGLIQTLKNAGYKTEGADRNLFVFYYDWTKRVDSLANDLKNYIETVVKPPPGEKIDLVGHSMGGLVARTYVQNNPVNQVDQLLTLGSPHKGTVQVYYLWEGGDIHDTLAGWQKIAAALLLYLRKPAYPTAMQEMQAVVPSFIDLLPTFNYLKQNSVEKSVNQMSQKNDWLTVLNSSPPTHLLSVLNNFVGLGLVPTSTDRWINVENRNWLDSILDIWPDGRPVSEEKAMGDDTVLVESAQLAGATATNLNLYHKELVETPEGQQKIMEVLGLIPTSIDNTSTGIDYDTSIIFQVDWADISSVSDETGQPIGHIDGKKKLAVIPGAKAGKYKVKIKGTPSRKYRLHTGQVVRKKDIWKTISGPLETDKEIDKEVDFNPITPLENPLVGQTGNDYLNSARIKLMDLKNEIKQRTILNQINQIIRLLDKNKTEDTIISLYRLRYQIVPIYFKNKIQEIIGDLENAYIISQTGTYNSTRLTREINLAENYLTQMEKLLQNLANQGKTKPDYGSLYSFTKEKLDKGKSVSSYEAHINILGAQFLSQEGLRSFR